MGCQHGGNLGMAFCLGHFQHGLAFAITPGEGCPSRRQQFHQRLTAGLHRRYRRGGEPHLLEVYTRALLSRREATISTRSPQVAALIRFSSFGSVIYRTRGKREANTAK
jgi:hypothetical protein